MAAFMIATAAAHKSAPHENSHTLTKICQIFQGAQFSWFSWIAFEL